MLTKLVNGKRIQLDETESIALQSEWEANRLERIKSEKIAELKKELERRAYQISIAPFSADFERKKSQIQALSNKEAIQDFDVTLKEETR